MIDPNEFEVPCGKTFYSLREALDHEDACDECRFKRLIETRVPAATAAKDGPIRHARPDSRGRRALRMVPPVLAGILAGAAVAVLLAFAWSWFNGQLDVWIAQ